MANKSILKDSDVRRDERTGRSVFEEWVFGDVDRLRRVDGTKVYPTNWVNQEDDDGELWSTALWNIYCAIGGDSLDAGIREAAKQALLTTILEFSRFMDHKFR